MREIFEKFFSDYKTSKKASLKKEDPYYQYVENIVPESFYKTGLLDKERYIVKASAGMGVFTYNPWICIFNKNITTSAQRGVYIVYLFDEDCTDKVYLTFNQGCTDYIEKEHLKSKQLIEKFDLIANECHEKINSRGFTPNKDIKLGKKGNAPYYENGTIFYKEYSKSDLPSENQLQQDLSEMIKIYDDYYQNIYKQPSYKNETNNEKGVAEMSIEKEKINNIKNYIKNKGFTYEGNLIENFYLSLKSKPFVILAGTSGTGKTRLAKLFAEGIGATVENEQFKLVPVRPDWSDSSDLFGHVNLNNEFVPGAILDFIKTASLPENSNKPYFLCLDEMNLARVEYYMSDFLSIIETRDFDSKKEHINTDPIMTLDKYGTDNKARDSYGILGFPENLYIVGTVNMDETTFPFSKKVLDRANTIEFSLVNLMPKFDESSEPVQQLTETNNFLKSKYLKINECAKEKEFVENWCEKLEEINKVLEKASLHVGYRVRDEIIFYLLNNKDAGNLISEEDAFDNELMQKILPRIQGSSQSINDLLCELFKICAGDFSGIQTANNTASEQMQKYLDDKSKLVYKNSAKKIQFMTRRLEEDGFTSYWL